jgi:hypothetical protein
LRWLVNGSSNQTCRMKKIFEFSFLVFCAAFLITNSQQDPIATETDKETKSIQNQLDAINAGHAQRQGVVESRSQRLDRLEAESRDLNQGLDAILKTYENRKNLIWQKNTQAISIYSEEMARGNITENEYQIKINQQRIWFRQALIENQELMNSALNTEAIRQQKTLGKE